MPSVRERAAVLGFGVGLACSVPSGNSDVFVMKKTPFYQLMRHKWRRKSLFTAIKRSVALAFLQMKQGRQTLVGAVPGMFQSALSSVSIEAMVYIIIADYSANIRCYNCPLDEGLCLYQE